MRCHLPWNRPRCLSRTSLPGATFSRCALAWPPRTGRLLAAIALVCAFAPAAMGLAVSNFVLFDHLGQRHALDDYSDAKAVVLIVHGKGCPVVRNGLSDLQALRNKYQEQGVTFLMINSNPGDRVEAIRTEAAEIGIDLPILIDATQEVGEGLVLTHTAEVLVLDPKRQVAYRGPIDDRVGFYPSNNPVEHRYLADALDAVLAGETPDIDAEIIGCLIKFPARQKDAQAAATSTPP